MADLLTQLRAYGRLVEAELPRSSAREPAEAAPETLGKLPDRPAIALPKPGRGETAGPGRSHRNGRSSGRPGRSAWLAIAAVTAALTVAVSLFFPPRQVEEGVMDKRSGLVFGVCIFAAGCTSGAQSAAVGTSVVGSAPSISATESAADGLPKLRGGTNGAEIPVEPGTYAVDVFDVPIEVTVPAGWQAFDELVLHGPQGASLVFVTGETAVYTNPCQWIDTAVDVGPGVADLVTALVAQEPTLNTEPRAITMGGYSGTELVLTSPEGLDFSTCYGGSYAITVDDLHRQTYLEAERLPSTFWILDLNGQRGIIATWSSSPMTEATKAQLDAMVASLKFG